MIINILICDSMKNNVVQWIRHSYTMAITMVLAVVLTTSDWVSAGVSTFADGIAVGTTNLTGGLLLEVEGILTATELCNESGTECTDVTDIYDAVINGVAGGGTAGFIPRFVATSSVGDSVLQESGGNVGIGISPQQRLHVSDYMRFEGRSILFGSAQGLHGDGGSALYSNSHHDTETEFVLRDAENQRYGSLSGSDDGVLFGLKNGDDQWFMNHDTDAYTAWYINGSELMRLNTVGLGINRVPSGNDILAVQTNNISSVEGIQLSASSDSWFRFMPHVAQGSYTTTMQAGDAGIIFSQGSLNTGALTIVPWSTTQGGMRINSSGQVGVGTPTPDGSLRLDVAGLVGSSGYCDENGLDCFYTPVASFWHTHGAIEVVRYQDALYFPVRQALSQADARSWCQARNGQLASVGSSAENTAITGMFSGGETVWIGGNDVVTEGTWVWEDGSPWSYINWASGEPNNVGNEDCLALRTFDAFWNDSACSLPLYSVCEIPL